MRRAVAVLGAAIIAASAILPGSFAAAVEPDPAPTAGPSDVSVSVVIPGPGRGDAPPARPPARPPVTAPGAALGGQPGGGAPATPPGPPAVKPGPAESAAPATVDVGYVEPGSAIRFSADGYTPGEKVQLVVYSTPVVLGSVTADVNGAVTASVSLAPDFPPGIHTLEATGWDSGAVSAVQFVVVGSGAATVAALDAPAQRTVILVIVIVALAFAVVALIVGRRLRLPFPPGRATA